MFDEYIALHKEYSQKYGTNTAIFLAVGSFYELYDIENTETGETRCNVKEIVDYLGIQLSQKKGDFTEKERGLFAGFPEYVLHKWAARLTQAGWTVVVVDQIKDHRGKVKERKVSRVLSPATHVEAALSTETPYVMQIVFSSAGSHLPPAFGVALLDLTTATTHTYSGSTLGRADLWTMDTVLQMVHMYSPKEVMIQWNMEEQTMPEEMIFRRMLGLSTVTPLRLTSRTSLGSSRNPIIREEYLKKVYSIRSLLPSRTFLGLRTADEEDALLLLLQFVEEHYSSMLRSFHKNLPWTPEHRLVCGNHTLSQLNIIGPNIHQTITGLYDKCLSPMGKRHIRDRLVNPFSDPSTIQARLDEVAFYMESTPDVHAQIERHFRSMYDLPRIHRRLLCGLITPSEIDHLFSSYHALEKVHVLFSSEPTTPLQAPFSTEEWITYMTVFRTHFDEDKTRFATGLSDVTALNVATYQEVGQQEEENRTIIQAIHQLRKEITTTAGIPEDAIRIEERSSSSNGEPYGFRASPITLQHLKKNIQKLPQGSAFSELKAGGWYSCTALDQFNTRLQKGREALEHLWNRHIVTACTAIADAGQTIWSLAEEWVSHVDATQCIAQVSRKWGFVRPTILSFDRTGKDEESVESEVTVKQIRHPLVELASPHVTFVRNDVTLTDMERGLLVYGLNAAGKSTLAKSLGIAVILAQCGAYVPAASMTLRPFQNLYSRIHNNDQLFAGLSSFAVEMSELRTILQNASPYTLVITDEMANGTESTSATAIVASSIRWLTSNRSKFISATHLHDLPQHIDPVSSRVAVKHLHVEYDPVTQKLVYDRTLRPGSGSTLYGIEVARALDLPREFIDHALAIRHQILGTTTQQAAPSSSWNSAVIRRACERCGHPVVRDLEVHHVRHRADADATGHFTDGSSMNAVSNLMVICQACHDALHRGDFTVGPVVQTSNGPERVIHDADPGDQNHAEDPEDPEDQKEALERAKRRHGKWTDAEVEQVKETLRMYPSLALKRIRAFLSSTHGIDMSESVLSRFRKEL